MKLSAPAKAIIDGAAPHGRPLYLGGARPAEGENWNRLKARLDAKAAELNGGLLPHWNLHDFRRTLAVGVQRLALVCRWSSGC